MRRLCLICAGVAVALAAGAGLSAQRPSADRFGALRWRLVGPFDGGTVAGVAGVTGEPGVYVAATAAGPFETRDGGATWQPDTRADVAAIPAPAWTDPSNSGRIARVESGGISVSLDGGATWTPHHNLPIASIARVTTSAGVPYWIFATERDGRAVVLPGIAGQKGRPPAPAAGKSPASADAATVGPQTAGGQPVSCVRADRVARTLRFACGADGVLVSFDAGARWSPLPLNLPRVAVTDLAIHGNDVVAATNGRSVWVLDDISPLRQIADGAASGDVTLFKPAEVTLDESGRPVAGAANLDYYVAPAGAGPVTLDVLDAAGARLYTRSTAPAADGDPWAPVRPPLSPAAGAHRVSWNLRLDPPPAPSNRYRRLAPRLFDIDDEPSLAPAGPIVPPGTYEVRLTVGTKAFTQALTVRASTAPAARPARGAAAARFDLARRVYDDLRAAHESYLRLARVRAAVKPLAKSSDPAVAQAAADFDARLADLDGSDWHFVLPDADDETDYDDKDIDEEPPPATAVALTKDYDDPTTIIGRRFENASHAPAFALVADTMTSILARVEAGPLAPSPAMAGDVTESEQDLAAVQAAWDAEVASGLPAFNAVLAAHGLPAIAPPDGRRP